MGQGSRRVVEMERRNIAKAKMLYDELDRNKTVLWVAAEEDSRSRIMNVTFVMKPELCRT